MNVIVAGKQPQPQWLSMDDAIKHCSAGIGIWSWASNDQDGAPDVVMACAGDVPTLETLAAVTLLREWLPALKIRVVNVVDLMTLQPPGEHPHGLSDSEFDSIFTTDKPILFAFHGYPWLIHRLTYRRHGHDNLHVRGYKEEGTTTTPFDMTVLNELDRFHLVEARDRSRARPRRARRASAPARARQAGRASRVHHAPRRRHAGDQELEVALAGRAALPLRAPSPVLRRRATTTIAAPRNSSRSRQAWRIAALFSPTPPVKAIASTPPMTAAYAPMYLRTRYA